MIAGMATASRCAKDHDRQYSNFSDAPSCAGALSSPWEQVCVSLLLLLSDHHPTLSTVVHATRACRPGGLPAAGTAGL